MIVNRAALSCFPAEDENFEVRTFEDEISGVMIVRKLNIRRDLVSIGFEILNQFAKIWKLQVLCLVFQFLDRSGEVHDSKVRSTRWRIKA